MGANPYLYVVSYRPQPDVLFPELLELEFCIRTALDDLRCWVFLAGNYQPPDPYKWVTDLSRPPEVSFEISKIREGLAVIKEELIGSNDGTRSILDLDHVAEAPGYNAVGPLPDATLVKLYGTTEPTREMVLADTSFFSELDRGQGAYIVLYKEGEADEILFAGYSYD
jgi:hypothetical protein